MITTIFYWICFVWLVAMCGSGLYRVIKGGIDSKSKAAAMGDFVGIVLDICVVVGIIYFYLH